MHFSLAELWQAMGPLAKGVVGVLIGMSLLSLTVAVEKWLLLSRAAKEAARFLQAWRERAKTQGYVAAISLAEKYPHCPTAQVVHTGSSLLSRMTDTAQRVEV